MSITSPVNVRKMFNRANGLLFTAGVVASSALSTLAACGGDATPPPVTAKAAPPPASTAAPDPLGPRPDVAMPAPYAPPAPVVFQLSNGPTVWLVERHNVPAVAMTLAVPRGSATDPSGKSGLAVETANMMDEGAGERGSLELAAAIDTLGATIRTGASYDYSYLTLTVLTKNLSPALGMFADVARQPRFEAVEWKRVHDLWTNELKNRVSDADEVADVVSQVDLFGESHPYGHPLDGTIASAAKVSLADVKSFYQRTWRPEHAVLVVVGDVTRVTLEPMLTGALGDWKGTGKYVEAPAIAAASVGAALAKTKVLLVDRPDAPQSVIALVRPGIDAKSPDAAVASRVNVALGGSFTSRLNEDLREEHGWSYGAHSRVTSMKSGGSVVARAAVVTEKTGEAAKALLNDMQAYAAQGPTDEEVVKTRMMARRELVEMFETDEGTAFRLARDAMLGLGPTYEADASKARDLASKADMAQVAARDFDPAAGFLLVVGPKAVLIDQLTAVGLTDVELRDADGHPVKATKAAKDKPNAAATAKTEKKP